MGGGLDQTYIVYWAADRDGPPILCVFDNSVVEPDLAEPIERGSQKLYLELATDADYNFFSVWEEKSTEEIKRLVNDVDGLYEKFNLDIILVHQNIWTTNNSPYPYTSNDITTRWDQLFNYWNTNKTCINRDAVALVSGLNYFTSPQGNAHGYTGSYKSICGFNNPPNCPIPDRHYLVSVDDKGTIAHELAHVIGIGHTCDCCPGQNGIWTASCDYCPVCDIMWSTQCATECTSDKESFLGPSVTRMNNALGGTKTSCDGNTIAVIENDRCLEYPAPFDWRFDLLIDNIILEDRTLICVDEEVTFTFFNEFDQLNVQWTLGPGLDLVDQTGTEITVKRSSTVQSFITVSFEYNCETVEYTISITSGNIVEYLPMCWDAECPVLARRGDYGFETICPNMSVQWVVSDPNKILPTASQQSPHSGSSFLPYPLQDIGGYIILYLYKTGTNDLIDELEVWVPSCEDVDRGCSNELVFKGNENKYSPYAPSKKRQLKTIIYADPVKAVSAKSLRTSVWPNPADGWLSVVHTSPDSYGCIDLLDLNGHLIFRQNLSFSEKSLISVADVPPGVYFLRVTSEFESEIHKIIIQR